MACRHHRRWHERRDRRCPASDRDDTHRDGLATDPVRNGFIESLSRPGGNITGLTNEPGQQIHGKLLGLLKEIVPGLSTVGVLVQTGLGFDRAAVDDVARSFGIRLDFDTEIRGPDDIEGAFAAMKRGKVDAYYAIGGPVVYARRQQVADSALAHRVPGIHFQREYAQAVALVSYGT
jgi:putative ABC transport system substrate-binding protein